MSLFWFNGAIPKQGYLKRVLIVHPHGIGDVLWITPVIRALSEYGVKRIDLLLGSRTREIFERNPHANEMFEWDKSPVANIFKKWSRFKKLAVTFWKLWRNHYQVVLDFSLGSQYAFLCQFFFWIPVRLGFNFKGRGRFSTHRLELPDGYTDKPVADYYLDLLNILNIQPTHKRTELFLDERDFQNAEAILKELGLHSGSSILAIAPGGGESWGSDARLKRWPVQYFVQLVKELHRDYGSLCEAIFILGGAAESQLAQQFLEAFPERSVYNLCGRVSIRTAAALIQKASLMLANDGGLVHVAHAIDTPVVAIYGPVDPKVYGPYPAKSAALSLTASGPACRPCYQRFRYQAACKGIECLTMLTPDRILARLHSERFLERLSSVGVSK
ncbi:MAG: hypothetical protein A3C35_00590 [Omnitrophica bacterium RIFCSPHIGHO2_02_FULL_46_11]|nr:MAG: hypothetical protein A3C35_00590 [Omnitrophica bacterium RIFCSPHIGHO2_02_FULL_46_11]OGW87643.1 MAG: hypothetical protein A3A81_04855 [Omnitrophica bacterium RIFCSPLOWO2_01_FULL_45_10b]